MAVLPEEIPTGTLKGQFYFVNEDIIDADTKPELTVVKGFVRCVASVKTLRMASKKAIVIPLRFDAKFDGQGNLVPENGNGIGMEMPAVDSPLFDTTGWTWKATFELTEAETGFTVNLAPVTFQIFEGQVTDLSDVIPVAPSPGVITTRGEQGPGGPAGLDGSNVLPTNDAVAQAIETEGPTKTALSAAIVERTASKAEKADLNAYKDATGFSLAAILAELEGRPIPEPVIRTNLWEPETSVLGNLNTTSGNLNAHASNRTSPHIPVLPSTKYAFDSAGIFVVVFYKADNLFSAGHAWTPANTPVVFTTPADAETMRITLAVPLDQDYLTLRMIANIGETTVTPETEGEVWDGNFWGTVPTPPLTKDSVKSQHIGPGAVGIQHMGANSVSEDALTPELIEKINYGLPPASRPNLWVASDAVLGNLSITSGNLNVHASNRTSPHIPVLPSTAYAFYSDAMFRVVFYKAGGLFSAGYDFAPLGTLVVRTTPADAETMRITLAIALDQDYLTVRTVANIGEDIYVEQVPDAETPGIALLKPTAPYPARLSFRELSTGWDEISHLSEDGQVVYLRRGPFVEQSLDDGKTIQEVALIPDVYSVAAIRDTADGELLVSTNRDESKGQKSKIFKSVGYERENPTGTVFTQVHEIISTQANVNGSWGLEAYDNICIASEYGLRDVNGARHVYLSTDFGATWAMIFDQKTTTASIPGAPTWTATAHLHTVHYDRYWDRIWLVVGDRPNSATYYSDDLGTTWKHVQGSDVVQYTGIVSFPDGVVFGSDRSPNGVHVWKRTKEKSDPVVIETLKKINDESVLTHVFQRAFRRYAAKNELALMAATRVDAWVGTYSSVIVGLTGIDNPHVLFELPVEYTGLGIYNAVGVTARGNILTSYHNGTNHSVMIAKAPVWE